MRSEPEVDESTISHERAQEFESTIEFERAPKLKSTHPTERAHTDERTRTP
jgi:hypothetical protein